MNVTTGTALPYTEEGYMKLGRNLARTFLDYYRLIGHIKDKPTATALPKPTFVPNVVNREKEKPATQSPVEAEERLQSLASCSKFKPVWSTTSSISCCVFSSLADFVKSSRSASVSSWEWQSNNLSMSPHGHVCKAVTSNDHSQLQSFLYCGVMDFGRCKSLVVINKLGSQIFPVHVNGGRLHFLQCLQDILEARSNCVLPPVCLQVKIFVFVFLGGIHRSNQAHQDIPRV
ncbi:AGBL4 [Acanthosepion pharaonis]|uniref:AGBL4 n=1 Tax=Acanthosepion pharaonis TaxID=158019 RepID=A0A812EJ64_ACAPH|nr:AGBL4 [Sepia pharaonis]